MNAGRKHRTLMQYDKITRLYGLIIRIKINLQLHYSTQEDTHLSWIKNVILTGPEKLI